MLQVVRVSGGVQAGAGQLVEGWDEQSAEASAGAGVGEVDGVRNWGRRVGDSSNFPAGIDGSFFLAAPLVRKAQSPRQVRGPQGRSGCHRRRPPHSGAPERSTSTASDHDSAANSPPGQEMAIGPSYGDLLSIAATQPRPCWRHPPAPVTHGDTGVARYCTAVYPS